jgi:hypothetical protein
MKNEDWCELLKIISEKIHNYETYTLDEDSQADLSYHDRLCLLKSRLELFLCQQNITFPPITLAKRKK